MSKVSSNSSSSRSAGKSSRNSSAAKPASGSTSGKALSSSRGPTKAAETKSQSPKAVDRVSLGKPEAKGKVDPGFLSALEEAYGTKPATSSSKDPATEAAVERIQEFVKAEHERFGGQVVEEAVHDGKTQGKITKPGLKEGHKDVFERVGDYWKSTGFDFDGKDKWAWSAAFITKAHEEAGVGSQFKGGINHSTYIRDAIAAKKAGDTEAAYWGHRSGERAPQVGDLLGYARESGVDYDHQKPNQSKYKSHTDVVTKVGDGFLEVIGGNVRDSVSLRRIPIDENGLVLDQDKYFVVMEPRNLGS